MIGARCPGHITGFFSPSGRGSVGAGVRIDAFATVEIGRRGDGSVIVEIDGKPSDAPITKRVLGLLVPGEGFDVTVVNDLPVGQGFGMSAAGAVAAGLCACEYAGIDPGRAYAAAHEAEVSLGGGRGDVAAIMSGYEVPVRLSPGTIPEGRVVDPGISIPEVTVAVLGNPMPTSSVLSDRETADRISAAGAGLQEEFLGNPAPSNFISLCRRFSSAAGLESPDVERLLQSDGDAAMCMLGNSVFAFKRGLPTLPAGVRGMTFSSTGEPASLL